MCVLTLGSTLLEGTGILLLLPLLSHAGISIESIPNSRAQSLSNLLSTTLHLTSLENVLVSYVLIVWLFGALTYAKTVLGAQLRFDLERQLRAQTLTSYLRANYSYVSTVKHSTILQIVIEDIRLVSYALSLMQQCAVSLATVALYLLASAWLSFSTMCTFVVLVLLSAYSLGTMRDAPHLVGQKLQRLMSHFHEIIAHYLGGLKSIKISGLEGRYASDIERTCTMVMVTEMEFTRLQARGRWMKEGILIALFALSFYAAFAHLKTPADTLIINLAFGMRLFPQMIDIRQKWQQVKSLVPRFEAVTNLIANSEAAQELAPITASIPFRSAISLRNVSFAYPSRPSTMVVGNFSCRIPYGSLTGIRGESGAGKTTIVDMISGILPPSRGEIRIDDQVLTSANTIQWRSQIRYMPQEPFLFSGTVRENLTWESGDVSESDLWGALQSVHLADFVAGLPHKLDSPLTNGGVELSGGQRQRLVLARAFLTKPSLLILDEVTSQLDSENLGEIRRALEQLRGSTTTVIVSHNDAFLEHMDQVIDIAHSEGVWPTSTTIQLSA